MQVMYIQQTRGPAQSASAQFWRSLQLVKARLEVFCFTTGTCLDLDIAASQDLQTFLIFSGCSQQDLPTLTYTLNL
jgi:hypothetical protein